MAIKPRAALMRLGAARFVAWLGLVGLVVVALTGGAANARVQPYYVVRGNAAAALRPRVLMVLDTSGPMGSKSNATTDVCEWSRCEDPAFAATEDESRIAGARRAVNAAVAALGDRAKFAVMTFEQTPPSAAVPALCTSMGEPTRFAWVDTYRANGVDTPLPLDHYGYPGTWRICQGDQKSGAPYLRWDELGLGSVITADDETGAVPASPLVATDEPQMSDLANARRRVQFFPRFLGVRVQLNTATDPDQSILASTVGDYAATAPDRLAEVWEQDFYYWPYVDGFVGYAQWIVTPDHTGLDRAGVAGETVLNQARLYAPFFLDLSAAGIPAGSEGPASAAIARSDVLAATSPLVQGGIDVAGNTPWKNAVGVTSVAPPDSNAIDSHTTVASYLKWLATVETPDVCSPTIAVLVTGGDPSTGEGDAGLYQRLAGLRNTLGVRTYVVGFHNSGIALNDMACAAAGGCDGAGCATPCDDIPADAWDTCANPGDPENACAYVTNSVQQLRARLVGIISESLEVDVESGPASVVNDFGVGAGGAPGEGATVQTTVRAYTEYPAWRGHVVRDLCNNPSAPQCQVPVGFTIDPREGTGFGPCSPGVSWDAGACLQATTWNDRRIFSYGLDNVPYRIAEPDGSASSTFVAELTALGLITSGDPQAEANAVVAFLLGRDAPGGWKLPGVANSAPVVVRRIPQYRPERVPSVNIRDPHCAGRLYGALQEGALPFELAEFARQAWSDDNLIGAPGGHYAYQEAAIIGDDMGVLHAFQMSSGNELFGLIPRSLLATAKAQAELGAAVVGQPDDVSAHIYGIAATPNVGWVYDDSATVIGNEKWRHLAVFGFGPGGSEYVALDLSHMSPESPLDPFEVLWSTDTLPASVAAQYDANNGETWSRPALTYWVGNDDLSSLPDPYLVLGSGYPVNGSAQNGRTLMFVDALTGNVVEDVALPVVGHAVYEPSFGALVDPAVGTHCLSRYWAEAQEAYVADPAGRLFRWDLGQQAAHESDSGGPWTGEATAVATFWACEGAGATCTVSTSNPADPFVYPPAISSNNRIDDVSTADDGVAGRDQFLVALVSGTLAEERTDPVAATSLFHTSMYLLVDDHRSDKTSGFSIPVDTGKSAAGPIGVGSAMTSDPRYMRVAASDVVRTRTIVPYVGATPVTDTKPFARGTRPVRPPRLLVTGVVDPSGAEPVIVEGLEVYYVTYTLYEPAAEACDPAFQSPDGVWHPDPGAVFEVTFRVTASLTGGFDFTAGAAGGADFGAGFETGLALTSVEQVTPTDTPAEGSMAATPPPPQTQACDGNLPTSGLPSPAWFAVPVRNARVPNFTPYEN